MPLIHSLDGTSNTSKCQHLENPQTRDPWNGLPVVPGGSRRHIVSRGRVWDISPNGLRTARCSVSLRWDRGSVQRVEDHRSPGRRWGVRSPREEQKAQTRNPDSFGVSIYSPLAVIRGVREPPLEGPGIVKHRSEAFLRHHGQRLGRCEQHHLGATTRLSDGVRMYVVVSSLGFGAEWMCMNGSRLGRTVGHIFVKNCWIYATPAT